MPGSNLLSDSRRSRQRRKVRLHAAVLILIVLARLGFARLAYSRPQLALANDTDRYVPIANALLAGTAYGWSTQHPGELLNTVGYPLFLAGTFALLGRDAGDVALVQLLTSGALAVLLYAAMLKLLGSTPSFLAAVLLAIDPLTILGSLTMLTETLFAVTLGVAAILLMLWAESPTKSTLALAGLFSAFACLVKPYAMPIVVIWTVALLVFPKRPTELGRRWVRGALHGVLFCLPAVVLLAPWFVRNGLLWDCPTLSSVDRVTMRDYMAAKVLAESEHLELSDAQARLQDADPGVCPSATGKYWGIILENPIIYGRLHIAGTLPVLIGTSFDRWLQYLGRDYVLPDLWRPYMDGGWGTLLLVMREQLRQFPQGLILLLVLTGFQLLLYLLAVRGFISGVRSRSSVRTWGMMALVVAILFLILAPGQGGHERFRVPVHPLLGILIAFGAGVELDRAQRAEKAPGSLARV